jgi:hypothetical protein
LRGDAAGVPALVCHGSGGWLVAARHADGFRAIGDRVERGLMLAAVLHDAAPRGGAGRAPGASTALDAVQVDALLQQQPSTVQSIVDVLGEPTGRGIKSFQEHDPWLVSTWTAMKSEIVGRESTYGPQTPTNQASVASKPRPTSYVVMSMLQSRLIVAHTADGKIQEIIWFAPRSALP